MRLVVCGGGTGGHVYPALAVVAALQKAPFHLAREDTLYMGSVSRAEATLVPEAGLQFQAVTVAPIRGRNPIQLIKSLYLILVGIVQAWGILGAFRPHVILATGGYISVPAAVAGWVRRIPVMLYVPDIEPGWAIRALSRIATRVAITAPPAAAQLPLPKCVTTGYPVRPDFARASRVAAHRSLQLAPDSPILLVLGGSQGAGAINRAIAEHLEQLLELCQLIHVSGRADFDELQQRRQSLPRAQRDRYHLRDYVHQGVAELLAAADLAVSRSGASVLGEFTALGLPSILIPYPHAGAHQRHNAAYLAQAGAAVVMEESHLSELLPAVERLLQHDTERALMAERARSLARPNAALHIAIITANLGSRSAARAQSQRRTQ